MAEKNILITVSPNNHTIDEQPFEIVERKGLGHPDTICDSIAEAISVEYSLYCIENFGYVLRHMIDKISVTGGLTKVSFGGGKIITPAKVHLKGRFTDSVDNISIPYKEISERVIYEHFKDIYFDFKKEYIVIENNTHFSPGPGIIFNKEGESRNERGGFFIDQTKESIQYHNNGFRSNDTSTGVCYFPLSNLETIVLEIEKYLNSKETKKEYPYIGTDIKVMGKRVKNDIEITICVPLISSFIFSIQEYEDKIKIIKKTLSNFLSTQGYSDNITLYINTRDRENFDDLYLTILGSALESGDEGAVGRGNRIHGVIPFTRNFTTEAACGKNPIYHVGKVYSALAYVISEYIYTAYKIENCVYVTSQIGRSLNDPWLIAVDIKEECSVEQKTEIEKFIENKLDNITEITNAILQKKIPLF